MRNRLGMLLTLALTLALLMPCSVTADESSAEPAYSPSDFHAMLMKGDMAPFQKHLTALLPALLETLSKGLLAERIAAETIFYHLGPQAVEPLMSSYRTASPYSLASLRQLARLGAQLHGCADRDPHCAEKAKRLGNLFFEVLGDEKSEYAAVQEAARGIDYLELGRVALPAIGKAYQRLLTQSHSRDRERALAELSLTAERLTGLGHGAWQAQLAEESKVTRSAASLADGPGENKTTLPSTLKPRGASLSP